MITIDLQNRKPIYEQIVERFETLIVSGVLEPDSQMPSVRSLAMELSINPNTIQKAYSTLEQEGYIYPVKGRGNFVSGNGDLKTKKQESVFLSLRELVRKGKELEISYESFAEKTRKFYQEGERTAMIKIEAVSKKFDNIRALDHVNAEIGESCIFGLVGTNGAGKSTLLRVISGVLKPEEGQVEIDGLPVWENPQAKAKICFLSDTAYFFPNATPLTMREYYRVLYPEFDAGRYDELLQRFDLDPKRKLSTFSKGMKKQVSVLLGICANTEYLLCDETFDGLDPVMRQAVKSLFAAEILSRKFTPVIASHSLREIEDICDHVGLLHKGGILFAKDLDEMKLGIHKIQCVIPEPQLEEELLAELKVLQHEKRGSLLTVIVRGSYDEIQQKIQEKQPLFSEILPLTLEEIFISETEVAGYDIKNLIF